MCKLMEDQATDSGTAAAAGKTTRNPGAKAAKAVAGKAKLATQKS